MQALTDPHDQALFLTPVTSSFMPYLIHSEEAVPEAPWHILMQSFGGFL